MKRVVVTGLGALTPIGNSVKEYCKALTEGVSGSAPITKFDTSKFKTKFACELKGFDILQHMSSREANRMDSFCQYAMVSTEEAIQDARIDKDKIDKDRVGVIWGSGIGGILTFQNEVESFSRNNRTPHFSPFFIPKMIVDLSAAHISMRYGFRGVNFSTVSACASATNAIIDALHYIRADIADIIITGGSEAPITECGIGGFNSLKALSTRNEDPKTACRPFDKERDGFVMGEGAGALILESYESAKKRDAKIYGEIVGIGLSSDAYHMTAPHPKGDGIVLLVENALKNAHLQPSDIDYINVHGTSTPLGDIAEIIAVQKTFKEHSYKLNISSTKSMIGHLLGAAGAVEAIACLFAMNEGIVPPTINHSHQDPLIDEKLNLTLNKAQKRTINYSMSNNFGFGGHNAGIIFKKI